MAKVMSGQSESKRSDLKKISNSPSLDEEIAIWKIEEFLKNPEPVGFNEKNSYKLLKPKKSRKERIIKDIELALNDAMCSSKKLSPKTKNAIKKFRKSLNKNIKFPFEFGEKVSGTPEFYKCMSRLPFSSEVVDIKRKSDADFVVCIEGPSGQKEYIASTWLKKSEKQRSLTPKGTVKGEVQHPPYKEPNSRVLMK